MTIIKVSAESPEAFAGQWRRYEQMLRDCYSSGGAPAADVDSMLDVLRRIYLRHAFRADQYPGAGDAYDRLQNWVTQLTLGLLAEIAEREAKLIAGDYGK